MRLSGPYIVRVGTSDRLRGRVNCVYANERLGVVPRGQQLHAVESDGYDQVALGDNPSLECRVSVHARDDTCRQRMVFRDSATRLRGRNHGGPKPLGKRSQLVAGISANDCGTDDEHGPYGIVDCVRDRIEIANDLGMFTRRFGVERYIRSCPLCQQIICPLCQQIIRYVEVYGSGSF